MKMQRKNEIWQGILACRDRLAERRPYSKSTCHSGNVAGRPGIDAWQQCGYNDYIRVNAMKKITVGSRELKTRLGTYLRLVQQGRTLVITDRKRPVAELTRIEIQRNGEEGRLEELAVIGFLTRKADTPLAPVRRVRTRGKSLSAAIIEDREDRF
jgi:antitoxin (DNA-binding transcriptional repressor) of toxin-antitoxin stability system